MYDVLKYIHENISDKLCLADVASTFGYSKWHFCSKFQNYTGKTFVKYVRYYRLQLASLDILMGKSITDVAFEYGYETLGGFNKAFLAEFGCLPREYKNRAKIAQLYYERRKQNMYQLTDRCEFLRTLLTGKNDYEDFFCMQHRVYTTLGMMAAEKQGLSIWQ